MQEIENVPNETCLMLVTAKRMARKYGQIGVCEPDDIAQNAMLRLLNRKDEQPPTFGWLHLAVRYSALDAGRRASRDQRLVYRWQSNTKVVAEQNEPFGYAPGFDACAGSEDKSEIDLLPHLKNVLSKLSGPLKQVLMLYSEGHSYEQIAQLTNVKLGTVRSRLHYARRRAKKLLAGLE